MTRHKTYRERHRDDPRYKRRRAAHSARYRLTHPPDPKTMRSHRLRLSYGITPEQYDAILASQDGLCALCLRPPKKVRLHVDHDHVTGVIRGLLCHRCNRGLGYLYRHEVLLRAVDYVARDTGLYVPKRTKKHRTAYQRWKEKHSPPRRVILVPDARPLPLFDFALGGAGTD